MRSPGRNDALGARAGRGRLRMLLAGLLAAAVAAFAFGAVASAQEDGIHEVRVSEPSNTWVPSSLEIEPGDTVRWIFSPTHEGNAMAVVHDVQIYPGTNASGTQLSNSGFKIPGTSPTPHEYTFANEGDYFFRCSVHIATMFGTISVEAAADTDPPVTSASFDPASPGAGGVYPGNVTLSLSAADGAGGSGVAETSYRINDGPWIEAENTEGDEPFVTTLPTFTDAGDYEVDFFSEDVAGNVEDPPKSVEFSIDPEAPEPPTTTHSFDPATADGDGGWYVSPVEVGFDVTPGDFAVARTEYRFGTEGPWQVYDPENPPVFSNTASPHQLHYYSVDVQDNAEGERSAELRVDTLDPETEASLDPAAPGAGGTYDVAVALTLTGSDSGSGIRSVEHRINGGEWIETENPSPGSSTFAPEISFTENGDYEVDFRSVDVAGNVESEPGSIAFTVDREPLDPDAWVIKARDPPDTSTNIWDPGIQTGPLQIEVGDTVRWEFDEARTVHNLFLMTPGGEVELSTAPQCPGGICLPGADPIEYSDFADGETYPYYCTIHGGNENTPGGSMSGIILVGDADPGEGPFPMPNPTQPPDAWESGVNERPTLSNVQATGLRLAIRVRARISEPGRIRIRLRTGGSLVRTVHWRNLSSGAHAGRIGNLGPGQYRVQVEAWDRWGLKARPAVVNRQVRVRP